MIKRVVKVPKVMKIIILKRTPRVMKILQTKNQNSLSKISQKKYLRMKTLSKIKWLILKKSTKFHHKVIQSSFSSYSLMKKSLRNS